MKQPQRPVGWMTLAQFVCLASIAITLFFLLRVVLWQDALLFREGQGTLLPLLRDAALTLCLVWAETEALLLCTRMKKASAFSAANGKALGRIAIALVLSGGVTLLLGDPLVLTLLATLPAVHPVVGRGLLPFTLLTLAAMVRAVQLLMRRALTMQEESDLTV